MRQSSRDKQHYGQRLQILAYGVTLTLQTGCATPPQEILYNNTSSSNGYTNSTAIDGITVNGACTTKYVYYVNGGNQTTHIDDVFENPAPNATIAGSAAVYINGGTELKLGATNWVVAAGSCYNTGTLPEYGIDHATAGNADFTGVVVVNFQTDIFAGGDDFMGPGTHVWGGCDLTGGSCTFNAALRMTNGIVLNGSGEAIGIEADDPAVAGVLLNHTSSDDRMVVEGTDCVYSEAPAAGQTCVEVATGVVGSLISGTVAPQMFSAPYDIVFEQTGVGPSTTIANNPQASVYGGEAATIQLTGALPTSPAGCLGATGYEAGTNACESFGPIVNPTNGCLVKSFSVLLNTAPGTGNATEFTILDNGVATAMNTTISGGEFSGINNSIPVSIAPGDSLSIGVSTTVGSPAAAQARAVIYGCG